MKRKHAKMEGTQGIEEMTSEKSCGRMAHATARNGRNQSDKVTIGNRVFINNNLLAMARGGITIEDDVQIAANVQLLTNNHDPYERQILICKPILIKKGAWIGAGATITPGVTIGKYAIVGASAVVTHDVGDYEVVVGNPARVIKTLDAERFDEINSR